MIDFITPQWVTRILKRSLLIRDYTGEEINLLKSQLAIFTHPEPLISVIIPAWNEEEGSRYAARHQAGNLVANAKETARLWRRV